MFPIKAGEIQRFDKQNEISVNVFGYKRTKSSPYTSRIIYILKWYLNVKWKWCVTLTMVNKKKTTAYFRSKTYIYLENDDNDHNLNEAYQKMNASLEEFIHKGSN